MLHDAPQFLVALEQSGLGAAIRQSWWAYPAANVGHILGLMLLAGAVAVMDARMLGAFAASPPASVVLPARRVAIVSLLLMAATGFMLFTAEASHVALNRVFQVKATLIALGVVNALLVARATGEALATTPAFTPLPGRVRTAAAVSLAIWLSVAACGRLIAYF
ncbi:MAG: hypothetical protein F9K29_21115 [Hyphomicrobiaceae bacterium]|nr:MAG: hypothetical protein F9K29_21115 [Hyphomicrobiaceae bacterium]